MADFWQLPGPAGYIDELQARICDGSSLLLWMPRNGPPDPEDIIARGQMGWDWRPIDASASGTPSEIIARDILYDSPDPARETVRTIASSGLMVGRVLWVKGISERSWPRWLVFVQEYSEIARNRPVHERGIIVLVLDGISQKTMPSNDVALTNIAWTSRFSELDAFIHASYQLAERNIPVHKKKVLTQCITKLSLWDWRLVERLSEERPERIIDAEGVLREYGEERGWDHESPSSWLHGTESTFDGLVMQHSAHLMLTGQKEILNRRLWSAQAGILLPLLEQKRLEILPSVRKFLNVPFVTTFGTIHRIEDLEIGHIAYQIANRPLGASTINMINRIRQARNDLAHLQPLSASLALHNDLYPTT